MTIEERKILVKKEMQNQQLVLDNRKKLKITGVTDVESFSENAVVSQTNLGNLTVKGDNLKISKLNVDEGELVIDGDIASMEYTRKKEKKKLFDSIFR